MFFFQSNFLLWGGWHVVRLERRSAKAHSHLILERSRAADGCSQGLVATAAQGMSRLQYRSGLHAPEYLSLVYYYSNSWESTQIQIIEL